MHRSVLFACVITVFAILAWPSVGFADIARVRGLAGGDARLLPDDDGTIAFFPNRLDEHRRIQFQNVAPDGTVDPDNPIRSVEDSETWGEISWDWLGGTAQWALNRPSKSVVLQRSIAAVSPPVVSPARSFIDFGFAKDTWGILTNFGFTAEEDKRSNWFGELAIAREVGSSEVAGHLEINEMGGLTIIAVGVDSRHQREGFFNRSIAGINYSNTDSGSGSTLNEFTIDTTAFHYGQGDLGSQDLTTLIAIGASLTNLSASGNSATFVAGPTVTGGGEYPVTSWLDIRGNVKRSFFFSFGDVDKTASGSETVATLGATGHWGQMYVNAVVQNEFFESGPDFIGGNTTGISNFVTVGYLIN